MRKTFLKLFAGGTPDAVVWTADTTYWLSGQRDNRVRDNGWDTEAGYLEFHRHLRCMPYFWYPTFFAGERVYSRVEIRKEERNGERRTQWVTPVGTLTQTTCRVEADGSEATTGHAVESEDDLRVLLFILEHSDVQPANIDDYDRRMAQWAACDGVPALGFPRGPLPAFLVEWAGVENGIYLLMDQPDLVQQILDRFAEQEEPVIEAVCRLHPPLVHFPDNLTSEVYTPFFETHMLPVYERRLSRLHAAGVKAAVHLDGAVRGLLPLLAAAGIDAIEAVTPQPAGDMPVQEMRPAAGSDSVILWGGVPGAMFAPPYTWADMDAHVRRVLDAWRGQRFILGVADQVPPDGDIDFVRRIADLVTES